MVKYCGEKGNPEEDTVAKEGICVGIQVGELRIKGNEKRMMYMEKERMGFVGKS